MSEFKSGNIAEKDFRSAGVTIGDAVLTGKIDLIRIDRENKKITVVDYKTGSIPLNTKSEKIETSNAKIYKFEQQLYFYKILIENSPEFAGYSVESGVLEFIEPSNKTERTYNHTVYFEDKKEEHLKQLIQAIWAKIKVFDFEINIDKYEKNKKGIEEFANDLIADLEGLNE